MGLLSTPPEGASVESQTDDGTDDVETSQPVESAPEPVKAVPLPVQPTSRRARAAAEAESLRNEVGSLRDSVSRLTEENRRILSDTQQQIARLTGGFEAAQRHQQQQQQATAEPTPDALFQEAQKHLDAGNFSKYQEKFAEAIEARALKRFQSHTPQQQAPQQPQLSPQLQAVIMTTPAAGRALSHPQGMAMVSVKDRELAVLGMADGPERWKKAFELADNSLNGASDSGPQFSPSARGALSGVPASGRGSGGGKQAPQVTPPRGWEQWAAAADMTQDEYLRIYADSHPDSVSK